MTDNSETISTDGEYVSHPLVTEDLIEARSYQTGIVDNTRDSHSLVTLPTGLGKTTVSLLLTAERLYNYGGKSLLLAPTKPLVQQHADFYEEALDIFDDKITVFTGEVKPSDRGELWTDSSVVIATPQVVENDIVTGRIDLSDVVHCTFDECHRATGDYSYNYIADQYHAQASNPLVTAMSASPGSDRENILTVCDNLGVENIEVRSEEDDDVDEYTYDVEIDWVEVSLPQDVLEIRDLLKSVVKDRMEKLKEMGVADSATKDVSQGQLNSLRGDIQKMMDNDNSKGYKAISVHAEVDKLTPAIQALEGQGVEAFSSYMQRNIVADANAGGSKASQRLSADDRIQEAIQRADGFGDRHPKLTEARDRVVRCVANTDDPRVLVFTESRDTAEILTDFLDEYFDVEKFVGQQNKESSEGMTQAQQKERLDEFRAGNIDVLVSTSVAEEGLDVPEVDLVVFYEPVPESVRTVQRRGRTGRQREGKVVVLMAVDNRDGKGATTTDKTYYWISQRRETQMESEIKDLKEMEQDVSEELQDDTEQSGLSEFSGEPQNTDVPDDTESVETENTDDAKSVSSSDSDETTKIICDTQEMDSKIPRQLSRNDDVSTRVEKLEVGDFVLSDRVAVERKDVDDFLSSITDGDRDIFQQVKELSETYERPILIVEGGSLHGRRNIHPNAIRATLSTIAVDFNTSVLFTDDADDTEGLLKTIAEREQEDSETTVSAHGSKDAKTLTEQQEYVVSSIVDVGPVTAESLLEEFGSVRAVINANKSELTDIDGIGDVTAEQITTVATADYNSD